MLGPARIPAVLCVRKVTRAFVDVFFQDVASIDDGLDIIFQEDFSFGVLGAMLPELLCDVSVELGVSRVELNQLVHGRLASYSESCVFSLNFILLNYERIFANSDMLSSKEKNII